jgi:transcriptional regulator with XRE-family HTH domain
MTMKVFISAPHADMSAIVRQLRESLGLTQQEFAHGLQKAISTVVRYESTRAPQGKSLVDLAEFALAHHKDDFARHFYKGLEQELGGHTLKLIAGNFDPNVKMTKDLETELSGAWGSALCTLLENPDLPVLELLVLQTLRSIYEGLQAASVLVPNEDKRDRISKQLRDLRPAYEDLCKKFHPIAESGGGAARNQSRGRQTK